jgi:hypothetical protein
LTAILDPSHEDLSSSSLRPERYDRIHTTLQNWKAGIPPTLSPDILRDRLRGPVFGGRSAGGLDIEYAIRLGTGQFVSSFLEV